MSRDSIRVEVVCPCCDGVHHWDLGSDVYRCVACHCTFVYGFVTGRHVVMTAGAPGPRSVCGACRIARCA